MKTISDLNGKIWYRLLKVIYILFFVFILGLSIFLIIDGYAPKFDNENSYIKCHDGKTLGLEENSIYLYSDYIWSSDDEKFRSWCAAIIKDDKLLPANFIPDEKNYDLVSSYTNRDWVRTVGYSLLAIIVTVFIFELTKRIFYYVVLGSIRPQK